MAEPLRIRFATDAEAAKQGIASLASSVASNAVQMGSAVKAVNDNFGKMQSGMSAVGAAARVAVPALLAFAAVKVVVDSVVASIHAAQEAIEGLVKLGNQAASAGVGTDLFQRWTGNARALGLETQDLIQMLNRAREAATVSIGEGDNAASSSGGRRLQQNVLAGNLSQSDLGAYNAATDQEARIRAVLDLIEKLKGAQRDLAAFDLASTFFGPTFEQQLRNGVDMVGQMRAAIDSTSTTAGGERIIAEEEVQRAREINAQLVDIENKMASGLAPIQADLAKSGQEYYQAWLDIKSAIAGAVKAIGDFYLEVKDVLKLLDSMVPSIGRLATMAGAVSVRNALGIAEPANTEQFGPAIPAGFGKPSITGAGDRSKSLPSLNPRGGSGGSDTETQSAYDRFLEQLTKANELAKTELENVGKSNVERNIATQLTRARVAAQQDGETLTDAQVDAVRRLAEEEQRAKDAAMDMNQAIRQNADAMRFFGQAAATSLGDMIINGKSASDVMKSLGDQLIRASLNSLLTGTGPLSGLFGLAAPASAGANATGGIFGALGSLFNIGKNAGGTDNWRGGLSWVGERGPELVNLPKGAQVIPNHALGGSSTHIAPVYNIDARGSEAGVEQKIMAALSQYDRGLPRRMNEIQTRYG